MRDYLVIAVILANLPIGLFRPFYGLLVYTWISYMYPHQLAWSFAQTFPVAKLSAFSVLGGTLFGAAADPTPLRQRENLIMILLFGMYTISTLFAIYPVWAWARWQEVAKMVLMALLTSMLVLDKSRMRWFLLVVGCSIGFFGFKGGLFALATGGSEMVLGPGNSVMGANNSIGLALNMCVPILWYLSVEETGWIKRGLQAAFFLTIPAIMFTYSRASAYTVAAVLMLMVLKSKRRAMVIPALMLVGALAAPFAVSLLPEKWVSRQQTVMTYEEDASAMSRIDNWKFCWRVVMDRPLTGAGFDFQSRDTFAKYAPEFLMKYNGKVWDTHSIYFSMLAGHGFPGFLLFFGMIAFCFLSCRRMRRQVKNRPDLRWVASYSNVIEVSLIGFLINGAFVNMEYFDLVYHWAAVVASLKVILYRTLAAEESKEEEPSAFQSAFSPAAIS